MINKKTYKNVLMLYIINKKKYMNKMIYVFFINLCIRLMELLKMNYNIYHNN